jgi:hypothetical protein
MVTQGVHIIVIRMPLGKQLIETEEGARIIGLILGRWFMRMVGGEWNWLRVVSSGDV